MAKKTDKGNGTYRISLTASDTSQWAYRANANWPGSVLKGRPVWAEFDQYGDLVNTNAPEDTPADEFNAIFSDYKIILGVNHARENFSKVRK